MTLTITLPEALEKRLAREARARDLSLEDYALEILEGALPLATFPTLEQVVAKIKALPRNPDSIHLPTASLADTLRDTPTDADFDLEQWSKEWEAVETEMERMTRENDIAEGRG